MANPERNLENEKEQMNLLEQKMYKNSFKKQYIEVENWKMRIEMITIAKNKEIQKFNEHMIEKKTIQDRINQARIQYCDYIQSLMENNWLLDLENYYKSLTQNEKTKTSKSNISVICNQLQDEINKINYAIKGLNLRKFQREKSVELARQINRAEHSISIWKDYITKAEKEIPKE